MGTLDAALRRPLLNSVKPPIVSNNTPQHISRSSGDIQHCYPIGHNIQQHKPTASASCIGTSQAQQPAHRALPSLPNSGPPQPVFPMDNTYGKAKMGTGSQTQTGGSTPGTLTRDSSASDLYATVDKPNGPGRLLTGPIMKDDPGPGYATPQQPQLMTVREGTKPFSIRRDEVDSNCSDALYSKVDDDSMGMENGVKNLKEPYRVRERVYEYPEFKGEAGHKQRQYGREQNGGFHAARAPAYHDEVYNVTCSEDPYSSIKSEILPGKHETQNSRFRPNPSEDSSHPLYEGVGSSNSSEDPYGASDPRYAVIKDHQLRQLNRNGDNLITPPSARSRFQPKNDTRAGLSEVEQRRIYREEMAIDHLYAKIRRRHSDGSDIYSVVHRGSGPAAIGMRANKGAPSVPEKRFGQHLDEAPGPSGLRVMHPVPPDNLLAMGRQPFLLQRMVYGAAPIRPDRDGGGPNPNASIREPSYRYITVRESLEVLRARMTAQAREQELARTQSDPSLHYYSTISEHNYEVVASYSGISTPQALYEEPATCAATSRTISATNAGNANMQRHANTPLMRCDFENTPHITRFEITSGTNRNNTPLMRRSPQIDGDSNLRSPSPIPEPPTSPIPSVSLVKQYTHGSGGSLSGLKRPLSTSTPAAQMHNTEDHIEKASPDVPVIWDHSNMRDSGGSKSGRGDAHGGSSPSKERLSSVCFDSQGRDTRESSIALTDSTLSTSSSLGQISLHKSTEGQRVSGDMSSGVALSHEHTMFQEINRNTCGVDEALFAKTAEAGNPCHNEGLSEGTRFSSSSVISVGKSSPARIKGMPRQNVSSAVGIEKSEGKSSNPVKIPVNYSHNSSPNQSYDDDRSLEANQESGFDSVSKKQLVSKPQELAQYYPIMSDPISNERQEGTVVARYGIKDSTKKDFPVTQQHSLDEMQRGWQIPVADESKFMEIKIPRVEVVSRGSKKSLSCSPDRSIRNEKFNSSDSVECMSHKIDICHEDLNYKTHFEEKGLTVAKLDYPVTMNEPKDASVVQNSNDHVKKVDHLDNSNFTDLNMKHTDRPAIGVSTGQVIGQFDVCELESQRNQKNEASSKTVTDGANLGMSAAKVPSNVGHGEGAHSNCFCHARKPDPEAVMKENLDRLEQSGRSSSEERELILSRLRGGRTETNRSQFPQRRLL